MIFCVVIFCVVILLHIVSSAFHAWKVVFQVLRLGLERWRAQSGDSLEGPNFREKWLTLTVTVMSRMQTNLTLMLQWALSFCRRWWWGRWQPCWARSPLSRASCSLPLGTLSSRFRCPTFKLRKPAKWEATSSATEPHMAMRLGTFSESESIPS